MFDTVAGCVKVARYQGKLNSEIELLPYQHKHGKRWHPWDRTGC